MLSRAPFISMKEAPQKKAAANSMGLASSFMVLGDIAAAGAAEGGGPYALLCRKENFVSEHTTATKIRAKPASSRPVMGSP